MSQPSPQPNDANPSAAAARVSATAARVSSVAGVVAVATDDGTRAGLLRALLVAVTLVTVVGLGLGLLLFGGDALLPKDALPFYIAGLTAAGFAAMLTVWLHGRFAATPAPTGDPARTGHLITARLQSLLAAAFGVKLVVLVLGVLIIKQFPLGEEPAKFSQLATFAVTFAGAALLCQLGTAFALARTLRR